MTHSGPPFPAPPLGYGPQARPGTRLKTEDSFKEKLAGLIDEMPDKQLSEHLADMKDSVRYTIQSSNDVYTTPSTKP